MKTNNSQPFVVLECLCIIKNSATEFFSRSGGCSGVVCSSEEGPSWLIEYDPKPILPKL